MAVALITRFTLQEAIRRRLFLAVLILSALLLGAFIILLSIAINLLQSNSPAANGGDLSPHLFLLSGGVFFDILMIWLVYLLSSLLTIVLTANMISGEVEAGTFAVIVPKPISRAEIVMGKWLGCALIIVVYTALMFFALLAIIYWKTGYWPEQVFSALGTLELAMLALLGLTTKRTRRDKESVLATCPLAHNQVRALEAQQRSSQQDRIENGDHAHGKEQKLRIG